MSRENGGKEGEEGKGMAREERGRADRLDRAGWWPRRGRWLPETTSGSGGMTRKGGKKGGN